MLEFLNKYAKNIFASQNGEEGILIEALSRMKIVKGNAVEVGASNGTFCSNTALLIRDYGWSAKLIETQWALWKECSDAWAHRSDVKCICSHVDQYNVNAFVDASCDVFSSDTDGQDYVIFKGLKAKPKIVIVEIDSSFLPDNHSFNSDGAPGYGPMLALALERGYFLLAHTGNMVFVDNKYRDLFQEIIGDGVSNSGLYFNRSWAPAT